MDGLKHFGVIPAAIGLVVAGSGPTAAATLTSAPFGRHDGQPVTLYTMTSGRGVTVSFMSYGGIITAIDAPDRHGKTADIVLGFPDLQGYETVSARDGLYFGALIGRYANRIARGHFTLDGHDHALPVNNGPNSLHGGLVGFDKRIWTVTTGPTSGPAVSAQLTLTSADGDQGYPGTLMVTVTYTLSSNNAFTIRYRATTDRPTVLNLTNHSYFNLAGVGAPNGVFDQMMTIDADHYTPTDATAIPLGAQAKVAGTPFDFRHPTAIGAHIRVPDQQLLWAHGYDHNWVLNKTGDVSHPQFAARLHDPSSGRTLDVETTQPGVQVYTGNFLNGTDAGTGGIYRQTDGVTFETQHYPDSPNHPDYPTTELQPGQTFDETTVFRFSVDRGKGSRP